MPDCTKGHKCLVTVCVSVFQLSGCSIIRLLPEASFGLPLLSVLPLCLCVCASVHQSRACPRDNSSTVQPRTTDKGCKPAWLWPLLFLFCFVFCFCCLFGSFLFCFVFCGFFFLGGGCFFFVFFFFFFFLGGGVDLDPQCQIQLVNF